LASAARVIGGSVNQSGKEEAAALQQLSILQKLPVGSPERRRAMEQYNKLYKGGIATQAEIDPGTKLSNHEVIGSFGNIALNVATPGAFKGGIGSQIAKNAVLGGGFGLAGGLTENKKGSALIGSTALGAGIGSVIPIAGKLSGKVKDVLTQKLPESLMNHAVKPTLDELRKSIKFGSPTLGKELLEEGTKGSATGLLKLADTKLDLYENQLQKILGKSRDKIRRNDIMPYLKPAIAKLEKTPGAKSQAIKFREVFIDLPREMTVKQANEIKRNLYSELRDVAYKLDPSLSKTKEAMKTVASGLKAEIEKKSGASEIVRTLNKKLSIYGRLEDRVVDQLARANRNNIIGLTDTILAGAGFINPLAFAGLLAKHASTSTRVLTNSAVGLNKLNKIGTGKTSQVLKQGLRRAIFNVP
jgi:hypothetical protein